MLRVFKSSIIVLCAVMVFGLTGCDNSSAFQDTSKAFSKSITSLQHEPGVSEVGFASDPTKNLFKIAIAVPNGSVTTAQLDSILNTYLTAVKNSGFSNDSQSGSQFLQPYNLWIEVHENSLGGRLLFVGQKPKGENNVVWTKD